MSDFSPPGHFNDAALKEWHRIVAVYGQRGLLDDLNLTALVGYCANYGGWVESMQAVKDDGALIENPLNGRMERNPMIDIGTQYLREWRAFLKELGMVERATGESSLGLGGGDPAESRDPDAFFLDAPARRQ